MVATTFHRRPTVRYRRPGHDPLKRIGELEDQRRFRKRCDRTGRLSEVIGHIDRGSILYKMLESALRDFRPKGVAASSGKKAAKGAPIMSPKRSKKKSRRK